MQFWIQMAWTNYLKVKKQTNKPKSKKKKERKYSKKETAAIGGTINGGPTKIGSKKTGL